MKLELKSPVKISQVAMSQGSHFFSLNPGKYSALVFEFISTGNNTGAVSETVTGNLILKVNGKEWANTGFVKLRELFSSEYKTKLQNALASGSPLNSVYVLPFHKPAHNFNVLDVRSNSNAQVEITGMGTTNVGSGAVLNVYGLMNPYGTSAYCLQHFSKSVAYPAGSSVFVQLGMLKNITKLLIAASSNITYIFLSRNGKLIFQAPLNIAKTITAMNGVLGTYADPAYWNIELVNSDYFDEFINSDFEIKFDIATATTVEMLLQQVTFNTKEDFEFSKSERTSFVNEILAKNEQNQLRNVDFIKS